MRLRRPPAPSPLPPGGVVLVTGAARGIGAALVRALADAGLRVHALDRDAEAVDATARSIAARHPVRSHVLDVTDAAAWERLVARILDEQGAIDALFNNAGVGLAGEVRYLSLDDWKRVLDVNVWGTIHGIHTVYPHMVERGRGVLVNTASGAGLCPRPGMVAYAAAKHAVVGLSTSLRAEAAAYGVQVHAVCPGYVRTDILRSTVYRGVDGAGLQAAIPIQPVTAEECARIVLAGVRRNRGIIPVSRTTSFEWALWRAAPGLVERVAALRASAFRRHAAAGDGDAPTAEMPPGAMPPGETPDGDTPPGKTPDGEA